MGPVVLTCDGCGARLRTTRPHEVRDRCCPKCQMPLTFALERALGPGASAEPGPPASSAGTPGALAVAATAQAEQWLNPATLASSRNPPARKLSWTSRSLIGLALLSVALVVDLTWPPGSSSRVPRPPRPGLMRSATSAPHAQPAPPPPPPPGLAGAELVATKRAETEVDSPPAPNLPPPPPVPSAVLAERPRAEVPAPLELPRPATVENRLVVSPPPARGAPRPQPPRSKVAEAGKVEPPANVLVRDETGQTLVARVHGESHGRLVVLLPDGQLGWPEGRADTTEPFVIATADEVAKSLTEGPFRGFRVQKTDHFVVVYQCSEPFATDSAHLLESLYVGLKKALEKSGIAVHEAEFPLVAVIFAHEAAFRAFRPIAPEVEAYYDMLSNRIYFYETSERERSSPEVAAIRKPQTVAHEGTHQILLNLGVQTRLADWPLWLVEGLAEYCAPTNIKRGKRGVEWAGLGMVNPLHMGTLHDLDEQAELQRGAAPAHIGRDTRVPLVEYLTIKSDLTPTDYALSWALTHYLAKRRTKEFVAFLKAMGQIPPLERMTPEQHLKTFREIFGAHLGRVDVQLAKHLASLHYEPLPYYAVVFEQPLGGGLVKRAALVSQSPSMIRQWLDTMRSPRGLPPTWQAIPFPTRTEALLHLNGQFGGP
jgi:hypothetical protein